MKLNFRVILILAAIALVVYLVATKSYFKGGWRTGYRFFRFGDSPGGDIEVLESLAGNVKELKRACNEHPNCIAFTTDGHLKESIVRPDKLEHRTGYPDWYGIYIQKQVLK